MQGKARLTLISVIVMINIAADQITKVLARKLIAYNEIIEVIGDYLVLTKVENRGAFLGMGSSLSPSLRVILLLVLPAAVMVGLFIYMLRSKELTKISLWGLSFIVGGGIGNIFDRIVYGSVTDMLFIDLKFAHTGIFNIADVSVMIGTGLILLEQFLPKKESLNHSS